MTTSDPQAVAWSVELRSAGRVCVDVSRGRSLAYLLVGLWMLVVAAASLVLGSPGWRVFGGFLLIITLGLVWLSVQQLLRVGSWRSPQVVVDADGITVRHGWLRVPWSELYGATASTVKHNRWVTLALSEACYETWRARRPWPVRLLSRRSRRWRHGTLQLPPNLAVDHRAFAAWLTQESQDRLGARVGALRHDLDAAVDAVRREAERLAGEDPPEERQRP